MPFCVPFISTILMYCTVLLASSRSDPRAQLELSLLPTSGVRMLLPDPELHPEPSRPVPYPSHLISTHLTYHRIYSFLFRLILYYFTASLSDVRTSAVIYELFSILHSFQLNMCSIHMLLHIELFSRSYLILSLYSACTYMHVKFF